MRTVVTGLLAAVIASPLIVGDAAYARDITAGEREWSKVIRACMKRAEIPMASITFYIVDDKVTAFYLSSVPHDLRTQCEGEANAQIPAPAGEKTDL